MAWTRGPTIGRGSTATVSIAATPAGEIFAVKSTDLSSSTSLQKEKYIISQLCSPYVIKCFGSDTTWQDNRYIYNLFLEYLPGGTLSDQIKKQGNLLDEREIRFYAHQLLQGLNYLHKKGLVHCDIKGQNILICNDELKIADFGCAKWAESGGGGAASAFSGTPAYMAPEVARGEEQSFPADIWAFGCTVIEMATGDHPWPEMKDPASTLYRVAFSGDVPEFPCWFSDEAKDFLGKCLMRDAKERWTAAALLQHPFFSAAEENCGLTRRSPTSVTDQGFWDAFEVSDSSKNSTEIPSSSDFPADRIRDLIGDASQARLDFTEEEGWLTVRCNGIEENSEVNEQNGDINQEFDDFIEVEFVMEEDGFEMTSILMEDSSLDCINGDSSSTFPVTHSESVREFLYSKLSVLKIMLMELFLHQDQLFLQLSKPFILFYFHHSLLYRYSEFSCSQ